MKFWMWSINCISN